MSTQTPNFGLVKPAPEDFYDIADFNGNADTIDTALQGIKDTADAAVPAAEKGKPGGVAKTEHTHTKSQITDFPTALPANGGNSATVGGKAPADFAAAVHTHTKSQITDFPTALPADGGNAATVGGMAPTDFAKATHNHTKSQITDFPASLPNPYALTLQLNGATNKTYNGSSAQTLNVTPGAIGAYTKSEIDQYVKYAVFGRSSDLVTSGYSGNFQFQDTRLGCYSHTASLASLNSSGMPVIKTAGKYLVIIRLYFVGQTSGIAINGLTIDTLLRRGSTSYSVGPTIIPGSWSVHAGGSVQFIANLNVNDYFTISYSCDPNAQKVTLNKTSAFYLIRLGA